MSPTGPSRTGAISVVLLGLIAVALFLILAALDRFHGETRELARAIDRLEKRVAAEADRLARSSGTPRAAGAEQPAAATTGVRPSVGDMLVMNAAEPRTFNRWTTGQSTVRVICNYIHDGLFNLDPETLEPRPALATSWEVSADKLRYVFHLRRDVVFSDGTPFTAKDVAFTLGVIQDPDVASDHCKQEFVDVVRTETPDDHTVVFHYRRPYWRAVHSLGFTLRPMSAADVRRRLEAIAAAKRAEFPPASYELEPGKKGFGKLYNLLHEPAIGTGPYRWDAQSLKPGVHLTLYRNASSWWFSAYAGKWNLAALRWRFVNDPIVALEEVRKQAIDLHVVGHEKWYDSFRHDQSITDHFTFQQYDHVGIGHSQVFWNCRRPLFADRRVRQALAHLIDRGTMRDVFNKGVDDYATCVFKPIYAEYSRDIAPRLLDLPRAKQLLAEAGWKDGNGDGVLERDGLEFRFTLMIPSGREEYMRWAQLWQSHMKQAGIAMEVQALDWKSFEAKFYDHEFDAAPTYYNHDDPWIEPYEQYVSSQTGKGQSNHSGWHLPEVDDLLERARVEFDPGKRRALYHRFNRIRDEHQPEMLLLHGKISVVVHERFRNVKVSKSGLVFEDWFVPESDRLYEDDGSPRR